MPKTPTAQPTTRTRLVTAMSRSLQVRGFGATSMKDLLDSTGVSSGSMYHAFPGGKEELAAAAVREVGLDAAARIRRVFAARLTAADGVATIFAALARDLEAGGFRFGCPVGVPATEASAASEGIQIACDEAFDAWIAAYGDALRAEGWDDDEAVTMALSIVTAYEGAVTIARARRDTSAIFTISHDLVTRIEAGGRPTTTEDP
ncbi:MAG: TetR/AcrR family transcriptional regulator [Actinomycetota bacterium]